MNAQFRMAVNLDATLPRSHHPHMQHPLPAKRTVGTAIAVLLLTLAAQADHSVQMRWGFDGSVKQSRWFPVVIEAGRDAVGFEVTVAQQQWYSERTLPVFRTEGRFAEGTERHTTLCRIGQRDRNQVIQCRVVYADGGQAQISGKPNILGSSDTVALVVSSNPHAMSFLAGVQMIRRGLVSLVPVSPDTFPVRWQELDGIDIVILDGPGKDYSAAQRTALQHWICAGGTALLTGNALQQSTQGGKWDLLPGIKHAAESIQRPAPSLAPFLGMYGSHLQTIPCLSMRAPKTARVLAAGEDILIAARDMGAGRVIALGFDWREMKLKDRIFFDGARQQLWSHVLALVRPNVFKPASTESVTPDEARAGFLAKYIALFMLVYVAVLGPLNWFVLRALKKLEYSIVTIPAGAVLFSAVAFCLGVSLRSQNTILRETEVLYGYGSNHGLVLGTAGILAPDRTPYTLHLPDGMGLLGFFDRSSAFGGDGYRQKELPIFSSEPGVRIRNVKIGTWSIRYFNTQKITDLGGSVAADLALTEEGLKGSIRSALDFPLRDAFLLHRWNRVSLGTLAPGTATDVLLPLRGADREIFPKCKNCASFHGSDASLSERYCRKHPLPEELRELADELDLHENYRRPVLVGWQDTPGPYVMPERDIVESARRRLCVFPLEHPSLLKEIVIPEGFVKGMQWSGGQRNIAFVSDARVDVLCQARATRRQDYGRRWGGTCFSGMNFGVDGSDSKLPVREYDLFIRSDKVTTTGLTVHWDAGEPDPDEDQFECVLKAYDWQGTNWVDVATGTRGEQDVSLPDPARFVRLPEGIVHFVVIPKDAKEKRSCSVNFLEIEYRGQR